MASTVLVVEDERKLRDLVRSYLERAGFTVLSTDSGAEAITMALTSAPDLVILDLGLPDVPGETVARELRATGPTAGTPILMLTAKTAEEDRIRGLELGADDYVTKPFSPRELVLRVNAILRRGKGEAVEEKKLSIGTITLDSARHQVDVGGKPVRLTSVEFKLLSMLMRRQGRVQERDRLLNEVWGYESVIDTRTVDTHVRRLRKKLGKAADAIETVRGFGYRIREAKR